MSRAKTAIGGQVSQHDTLPFSRKNHIVFAHNITATKK